MVHKTYTVISTDFKENVVKSTASLRLDLTRNGFYRTMEFTGDEARANRDIMTGEIFKIEED